MKYTKNFNFKKPEGTDYVNIEDLNDNFEEVDKEIFNAHENLKKHKEAEMPHQINVEGAAFNFGLKQENGHVKIIYEEA